MNQIQSQLDRVYNFNAGPSVLPVPVLEQVAQEMLCLPGAGVSILELGHRTGPFKKILADTVARLRAMLSIPSDYDVFFVQGGGRLIFSVLPMNFCLPGTVGEYLVTGSWGECAYQEARRCEQGRVVWSGKDSGYSTIPQTRDWSSVNGAYLHYTSNETIEGVQFPADIAALLENAPSLVCDMSSDFMSRPVDVGRYAMIYACIQKNLGPAGATLVIAKREFLERASEKVPGYCRLLNHAEGDLMYNTPPTFCIYVANLVLRWLESTFGDLKQVQQFNQRKVGLVYDALLKRPDLFQLHAHESCRSQMNVTFRLPTPELEKRFLHESESQGLAFLAGHRSVGGMRASLYNAMPIEGAQALAAFVEGFDK
ncbi:MAG: 3-phosphoserine/phosphohydroxythreonine transaminase [Planctomycetaceae bacterium]|nr:3-phosphoserine/phosphohydroxythreonine transaminase [Planctomycetaceae bacterium]